jgi:aryl-alcohol dehydrogenase-like predicted oxidoreductase
METIVSKALNAEVSRIGLGTWAIGGWLWGGTDEKRSIDTILAAFDKGITLIDTAPAYGFGLSEEIIGKALQQYGKRDKVILVTKTGIEWHDGSTARNSTRKQLLREVDDSLRRLRTDYIDAYLIHWPDPMVPLEETAETMNEIFRQEKIRALGVSNFSPKQMDAFQQAAPLQVAEPPYNLFERDHEHDVLPYCRQNDITILAYSALCRGLLSGRMTADREFEGDDLRKQDPKFSPPRFEQYLSAASRLGQFVQREHNRELIHLAVRWILDQGVEVALWGARSPGQLDPVEGVIGWSLNDDDREQIDRILEETISQPVGPDFMAPPLREIRQPQ